MHMAIKNEKINLYIIFTFPFYIFYEIMSTFQGSFIFLSQKKKNNNKEKKRKKKKKRKKGALYFILFYTMHT